MLNPHERERIQDCLLLIQSAESALEPFDESIIPEVSEVRECFDNVQTKLRNVLLGTAL